jgi:hypothetical protein
MKLKMESTAKAIVLEKLAFALKIELAVLSTAAG